MINDSTGLSRGMLSKRTGVNGETIRYYEKINLMPAPARSPGGYRIYDVSQLKRLSFIKRCRELGFTLKDIAELLTFVDGGNYTCAEIRDHIVIHLKEVSKKISDLKRMQKTLKHMVSECEGGLLPECPIIDSLFDA